MRNIATGITGLAALATLGAGCETRGPTTYSGSDTLLKSDRYASAANVDATSRALTGSTHLTSEDSVGGLDHVEFDSRVNTNWSFPGVGIHGEAYEVVSDLGGDNGDLALRHILTSTAPMRASEGTIGLDSEWIYTTARVLDDKGERITSVPLATEGLYGMVADVPDFDELKGTDLATLRVDHQGLSYRQKFLELTRIGPDGRTFTEEYVVSLISEKDHASYKDGIDKAKEGGAMPDGLSFTIVGPVQPGDVDIRLRDGRVSVETENGDFYTFVKTASEDHERRNPDAGTGRLEDGDIVSAVLRTRNVSLTSPTTP